MNNSKCEPVLDEIEKLVAQENLSGEPVITKTKFKVRREVSGKTDAFEIGDRIKIKINKEKHFATAIQQKGDMTLFVLDDCLNHVKTMKCDGDSCYENSEIRKFLKDCKVSKKYRDFLVPAKEWYETELPWGDDGLFLLSVEEVCGLDSNFNDSKDKQLTWFENNWRNRIGLRNNKPVSWWLRDVYSVTDFCGVLFSGTAYTCHASSSYIGVRPAFVLRNHTS